MRWRRGEGEKRKEGLTQSHSANRVTHLKSGCGSEEFKKALEGALKFFPGMKIKYDQELCFQSLVVKRKDVLGVWKSVMYQLLRKLCPSIGFTRPV